MLTLLPMASGGAIAEQLLGGARERLHDAVLVDDDHGVGNGVEDRLQVRLADLQFALAVGRLQAAALQPHAEPRHGDADEAEGDDVDEAEAVASAAPPEAAIASDEADDGGGNPRAEAAEAAGHQNRRNEQDQLQVAVQRRIQQQADDDRQRHGGGGDRIVARRPRAQHADDTV